MGLELDWWVGHLVMLLSYRFEWTSRIRLRPLVFKALGCVSAVASSHPLCGGEALTFKTTDAPKELCWWRTVKASMVDYKLKRESKEGEAEKP